MSLIDLQKKVSIDKNFEWYTKNYDLFDLDTYFYKKTDEYLFEENKPILFNSGCFGHWKKDKYLDLENIKSCASSMELHIKIRGLEILGKLNSKLLHNNVFNSYYRELISDRKEKIEYARV